MKHFYLLLLLVILAAGSGLRAQNTYRIGGMVGEKDEGVILGGANIILVHQGDSTRQATISDEKGQFLFFRVKPGNYTLMISYIGYHDRSIRVEIAGQDVQLGRIILDAETENLNEVVISEKVVAVTQSGDTSTYNAGAFKTAPDATTEELVQKMPGITVENNKVEAQGEKVKEVLVDGRPFFGDDPMSALRNLPAEVVEKIQVFDKRSEQSEFTGFDDGDTYKAMNVVTRMRAQNGQFGRGYAGIGWEDKYRVGGNYNSFKKDTRISVIGQLNNTNEQNFSPEDMMNVMGSPGGMGGGMRGGMGGRGSRGGGGLGSGALFSGLNDDFMIRGQNGITRTMAGGINYSDKWTEKTEVSASYFYNDGDNDALSDLYRQYVASSDSGRSYAEFNTSASRNINHRVNMKFDYRLDSNNWITFRPRISMQLNDGTSLITGETFRSGTRLNESDNRNGSDLTGLNYSGNFLYRHRFNKKGRTLSVNAGSGYNLKEGDQNVFSLNHYYAPFLSGDTTDQQTVIEAKGWNGSGNISYTEPVGPNGQLQASYNISYQESASERKTWIMDPYMMEYTLLDAELSNTFNSYNTAHQYGLSYRHRTEKSNTTVKLAYQDAILNKDQEFPYVFDMRKRFSDLLPSVVYRYNISRSKNLNVTWRTMTNPPSIDQLQEVVDNSNTLQLRTGNSGLIQDYSHQVSVRYSSMNPESSRVFFFMAGGGLVNDQVSNCTYLADSDTVLFGVSLKSGQQLVRPENLDGAWNARSFITYGFPIPKMKSNLNFNTGINFSKNPGSLNGIVNYSGNTSANLGWVLSSNISERFDFTLSSRSTMNWVRNSEMESGNYNYFNQTSRFRIKWVSKKGYFVESNVLNQFYEGLDDSYDPDYWLWGGGIGKKLFKNQRGEITLSVFDILGQNSSITRTVNEAYIEDNRTNVLDRYYLLTFAYNVRKFAEKEKRPGMPPPWHD